MDISQTVPNEEISANAEVIVLVPHQDPNVLVRAGKMQKIADSYDITTAQLNECACDDLKAIKTLQKRVEECRVSEVTPFNVIVKATNDKYRPAAEYLANAESILKSKISGWMALEKKRTDELQRIADEAARLERVRLENQAREQRELAAKAAREVLAAQEAIATAARQKQEAEEAVSRANQMALDADQHDNAEQAQLAFAEIEKANLALSQARLIEDNAYHTESTVVADHGAAIEQAAVSSMTALAVTATSKSAQKVSGISSKTAWKARITNKAAFLKYVAENPERCADWVEIKMTPLNGLAKAMKETMEIPGVEAYPDISIAARAA
jgi:hypothetical protein